MIAKPPVVVKLLLILILSLLIADFTAGYFEAGPMEKVYLNIRTYDPYFHHGLKPSKEGMEPLNAITKKHSYYLTTNSLGFKDNATRQVPLKTDRKRIVFLGDSYTEGVYLPYDETFVGLIATKRKDLDILNAAVISYSPLVYYLKTDYLINHVGLKFDELFVLIDTSDSPDDYQYHDVERFAPSLDVSFVKVLRRKIFWFLYNNSFTFNYLVYKKADRVHSLYRRWGWVIDESLFNEYGRRGLELSAEYMKRLVVLCRKHNIRLTLVVYPWPQQIGAMDMPSIQERFWEDFAGNNGVELLDLYPFFLNDPKQALHTLFEPVPGDIHWNSVGHVFVADKIINYLRTRN